MTTPDPTQELVTAPGPRAATAMRFTAGGGIVATTLDDAWRLAQLFARSDMVPKDYKGKPENVLVAIQMGAELGLKPLQAVQGIAVINGRPSVWGDALWALIQSSPLIEDATESFDAATMTATCRIKRRDRSMATIQSFSKADAELAGLWGKSGPWTTNPRRMLQMRARAFAGRDSVPEVLKGLAIAEEALDIPAPIQDPPAAPAIAPTRGTAALRAAAARSTEVPTETAPPTAPAASGAVEEPIPVEEESAQQVPLATAPQDAPGPALADYLAFLDECATDTEISQYADSLPTEVRDSPEFGRAVAARLALVTRKGKASK